MAPEKESAIKRPKQLTMSYPHVKFDYRRQAICVQLKLSPEKYDKQLTKDLQGTGNKNVENSVIRKNGRERNEPISLLCYLQTLNEWITQTVPNKSVSYWDNLHFETLNRLRSVPNMDYQSHMTQNQL